MTERDQFGPALRRERERRGISLQDIAERTKISAALFAGLERNDVSRWPSGIYRRSFVRAYAEVIGLDGARLVEQFQRLFPAEGDSDNESVAAEGCAQRAPSQKAVVAQDPGPATALQPSGVRQHDLTIGRGADEGSETATAAERQPGASIRRGRRVWRKVACLSVDLGLVALAGTVFLVAYGWPAVWPALTVASGIVLLATPVVARTTPGTWLLTPRPRVRVAAVPAEATRRRPDERQPTARRHHGKKTPPGSAEAAPGRHVTSAAARRQRRRASRRATK